ncbi:MAG: DoxX family protein [Acidobacteria bacterium]|nr:MAG: DoxX family protein [Acidobacteriota bacterium]
MGRVESEQVTDSRQTRFPERYAAIARSVARILLGGIFVFAAATKIYDPGSFAIEVERYQLLPWQLCVVVADYLPWLELVAGLSLFHKSFGRGAVLIITLLLTIFTLALASALFRGLSIDCGCFGHAILSTGTILPILRNLVLLLFAGILWTR